ncbi:MAG TPA: hypothetical protein ENH01_07435 [Nitrospirae bacterium]|nr:hypothetical protein [Nitrospirota bacterium]
MKLKIVSVLIVFALMLSVIPSLISNAPHTCDKEQCPVCITSGSTPLSVILITHGAMFKEHVLTLSGIYYIFNTTLKPSLIVSQIDRPPESLA